MSADGLFSTFGRSYKLRRLYTCLAKFLKKSESLQMLPGEVINRLYASSFFFFTFTRLLANAVIHLFLNVPVRDSGGT